MRHNAPVVLGPLGRPTSWRLFQLTARASIRGWQWDVDIRSGRNPREADGRQSVIGGRNLRAGWTAIWSAASSAPITADHRLTTVAHNLAVM
jgi:hypothetical protein